MPPVLVRRQILTVRQYRLHLPTNIPPRAVALRQTGQKGTQTEGVRCGSAAEEKACHGIPPHH